MTTLPHCAVAFLFAGSMALLRAQTCADPTVQPSSIAVDNQAASVTVTVTAPSGCSWALTGAPGWISGTTSGRGSGAILLSIASNTGDADRQAALHVNYSAIGVKQAFTETVFTDVPPSAPYFDAVNLLYAKGLAIPCQESPLKFCPQASMTRALMAVSIVTAIFNELTIPPSTVPQMFSDVPPSAPYYNYVQELSELGITSGCAPDLFCPTDTVTREQMAIFIIRARYGAETIFVYPTVPYFTDVPPSAFGFAWIQAMGLDQIVQGTTTFDPNDVTIRGDMATWIMRGAFNQLLPATQPLIVSISPATLTAGASGVFTITGVNTQFQQGVTGLTVGSVYPGVTVNSLTVLSPTVMQVNLSAASTALLAPVSLYSVTGVQDAVLPNGLNIVP